MSLRTSFGDSDGSGARTPNLSITRRLIYSCATANSLSELILMRLCLTNERALNDGRYCPRHLINCQRRKKVLAINNIGLTSKYWTSCLLASGPMLQNFYCGILYKRSTAVNLFWPVFTAQTQARLFGNFCLNNHKC
jgi:hypothetical protein